MSELERFQRAVLGAIQQPLTPSGRMRSRRPDGTSLRRLADEHITPNDRLTAFERLEIYSRSYWFRIRDALAEDFPGLAAVVGARRFARLTDAYLAEVPSESFTLRNLGARLPGWLAAHPEHLPSPARLALDMVALEWADIEAFDAAEWPRLTEAELQTLGEDPRFQLQPHLRLLELEYPVDELLLGIRAGDGRRSDAASNAVPEPAPRRVRRLRPPRRERLAVAVHRQDNIVYFKRLEREALALLRVLGEGQPVSAAIAASLGRRRRRPEELARTLHAWFADFAALGWLCRRPTRAYLRNP